MNVALRQVMITDFANPYLTNHSEGQNAVFVNGTFIKTPNYLTLQSLRLCFLYVCLSFTPPYLLFSLPFSLDDILSFNENDFIFQMPSRLNLSMARSRVAWQPSMSLSLWAPQCLTHSPNKPSRNSSLDS